MNIRFYEEKDEREWVRCRVLSFLDTAYFDHVLRKKETYENPSIELIAEKDGQIIGLIDIEIEKKQGKVCTQGAGGGGMIWHIAVHPDFRQLGAGTNLLHAAERHCREKGLDYLEAWTRDDEWVNKWYVRNGFTKVDSYMHVLLEGREELSTVFTGVEPDFHPIQGFAHFIGDRADPRLKAFKRVHECMCYVKTLR
ncbi:GNAT family N-acetyltransferase [Alkalihalobacillus sp. LMS6]|uniref:GNAT family N-acetyltransferase n=1 Tax=Alkalihalobacillus sp. LMS6 TaxID=2924034 RepID=UPI0020D009AC|nr:GNAT family N-acetyltransferase [Alkalihalobacillus sp. LMS6]UTR07051.1 GNAT family N-acetyltransferase [Alkalihalobacillus sp. LMS6]